MPEHPTRHGRLAAEALHLLACDASTQGSPATRRLASEACRLLHVDAPLAGMTPGDTPTAVSKRPAVVRKRWWQRLSGKG